MLTRSGQARPRQGLTTPDMREKTSKTSQNAHHTRRTHIGEELSDSQYSNASTVEGEGVVAHRRKHAAVTTHRVPSLIWSIASLGLRLIKYSYRPAGLKPLLSLKVRLVNRVFTKVSVLMKVGIHLLRTTERTGDTGTPVSCKHQPQMMQQKYLLLALVM